MYHDGARPALLAPVWASTSTISTSCILLTWNLALTVVFCAADLKYHLSPCPIGFFCTSPCGDRDVWDTTHKLCLTGN